MYIKTLKEISRFDVQQVGGKAASLGELTKVGINIPSGFVITAGACRKFVRSSLPKDIKEQILIAFDSLKTKTVAVRSSGIGEDSSRESWAGQFETYLNVRREELFMKIKDCWDSVNSLRVRSYAAERNIKRKAMLIAVIIQKMVQSRVSGVMFTINPVTHDSSEVMIESMFGLGEILVQGVVTPDNFIVDKKTKEVKSRDIQQKKTMLVLMGRQNRDVAIPRSKKNAPSLSDKAIRNLVRIGVSIESHYKIPQDIEWAIDRDDKLWILQSRPITTR